MAFAFPHHLATAVHESALGRAVERLRSRRADRHPARMPVAMVTASLGGHPLQVANRYR